MASLVSLNVGRPKPVAWSGRTVVTGVFLIMFEDRELEARFGEEYRAYKQRVPAVLPFLPQRRRDAEEMR